MTQVNINGELFDVFIVRGQNADPVPVQIDATPRTVVPTVSVSASTTSKLILAANTNRKNILIYNQSTSTLMLSHSNPATAANAFMEMQPRSILGLELEFTGAGAIYGFWNAANGSAQVTEFI